MSTHDPSPRRPARTSRWIASGLTAAVAVGSVTAMEHSAPAEADTAGHTLGAIAGYQGDLAVAAALMAAADPGDTPVAALPPPRIGRAGVS